MSHFSLKSLTFYGVAIGTVAILFKAITAYGETSLKAPPAIDGNYALDGKNLPGCLKSQTLKLVVLQSGIYLNGAIDPISNDATEPNPRREKPTLMGRFQNGELSLFGTLPELPGCSTSANHKVTLQGHVAEDILQGQIQLGDQSAPFQSQRQKPQIENSD